MEIQDGGAGLVSENLLFFRRFLRNPLAVGAIAPSSRRLGRSMVRDLDPVPGVRLVEFGPGTGSFTSVIAGILPADGSYLGIERDPVFVSTLQRKWPALDFACDSVENLVSLAEARGLLPIDHIVSGLPFASLPARVTMPVLDAVSRSLRPGGTFTTFQYVHASWFPAARAFRREMARRFGPPAARRLVVLNLPPAFAITWCKGGRGDPS
jgi:phosphatidylethanolamine/phosphatidyl-N-methylethanolamine N-methyltransferase